MSAVVPRLRDAVSIRPFDAGSGAARHIVAVDDRHFVVSAPVAALLEEMRGISNFDSLASRVSHQVGRAISSVEIQQLLRDKIPPVVFEAQQDRLDIGQLHLRLRLITADRLAPLLRLTAVLFAPLPALSFASLFLIVDALVIARAWPLGFASTSDASFAGIAVGTLLGVGLHELGHLSACHRYGASHGGIGVGLYWVLPVCYAEVHGAWMLERRQRAVVDLGGIYFQCLWLTAIGIAQLLSSSATLLMILWWSHLLLLNTLNPVLKFDGYWLLSDLTGSYNLHQRIRDHAQRCWRSLCGASACRRPSASELTLLACFAVLACSYFGYLMLFMAHNLASAVGGLLTAVSADVESGLVLLEIAARTLWLALLSVATLSLAAMLAHAVQSLLADERTRETQK